jgi:hypothetical protein
MANHGKETNQSMSNLLLPSSHPHPTVGNPGDDQSMSNLLLPSSHPHPTVGNPGDDQSMSDPLWTSSHPHSTHGGPEDDQFMGVDDWYGMSIDIPSPSEILMEGIPSPGLAADAAAVAEIGEPASGSLGENSLLTSAAVANKLPPARHRQHRGEKHYMELYDRTFFDVSTSTARAMRITAALDDDGIHGSHPAQGLLQPEQVKTRVQILALIKKKYKMGIRYEEEAELIRLMTIQFKKEKSISNDRIDYLADPFEPPTSKQCYFTRFMAMLFDNKKADDDKKDKKADDDKKDEKKAGYWKEKETKAIRDPSASRNIIGMKRTLEFMNGGKRTRWLADEYVALEPWGHDAVHILVRTPH